VSFNGTGTFVINSSGQPVVSGTVISATVFNALTADLATGLSTCITKDGQTTPTNNIPMGGFKITGLGAGTVGGDAVRLSQLQAGTAQLLTVSGTDTLTALGTPALTAYAAGNLFYFVAAATNTTSVTLNVDGLGAKAVTRHGSTALVAGDILAGEVCLVVYDGTRFQLLNPGSYTNLNVSGNLTLNAGTVNGVAYLNASRVVTSGLALVFDGTNLGIGNASPSYPVSVVSSNNGIVNVKGGSGTNQGSMFRVELAGGTGAFAAFGDRARIFGGTPDALASIYTGAAPLTFDVNGAERARFDSSGNLGIGTSSPTSKLVVSNAGAQGFEFDPANGIMQVFNRSTSAYGELRPYGSLIRFFTGTSPVETMRLDSSGNLGIGTSSPGNRVTINDPGTGLGFSNAASGNLNIGLLAGVGSAVAYVLNRANSDLLFGTNDITRASITAAGNFCAGAQSALATTATNGFLYVPTCAGVPTGTPTAITGMAPIVVDTTNNRWYFYSGGAWRNAGP
jgi:hypothetical protein